jgi:hypothetical protein
MLASVSATSLISRSASVEIGTTHLSLSRQSAARIGAIVAQGDLADAPKIHRQLISVLRGQHGLDETQANLLALQIMGDAMKDTSRGVNIGVSLKAYEDRLSARIESEAPADPIETLNAEFRQLPRLA